MSRAEAGGVEGVRAGAGGDCPRARGARDYTAASEEATEGRGREAARADRPARVGALGWCGGAARAD